MRVTIGSRLGRYELVARVGEGGWGEVYKARDQSLNRTVAIKVLRPDKFLTADARAWLATEAEVLARLNHPRICTIYDIGSEDGLDFFVMEYLEGQTLASLLRRGRLSWRDAFRYAREIAEGLAAAHQLGVVHRDIKPSNVFITLAGAKLLDFGIARLLTTGAPQPLDSVANASTTVPAAHERVLGTPPYMAPEILRGAHADVRSDMFSYGAVLFEMLTGQPAFRGDTWLDRVRAILQNDTPSPGALVQGIPATLDRLVSNCLAQDPAARWQSAQDAVLALKGSDEHDGALIGSRNAPFVVQRLTFQRGTIYSARFAPEGTNVLYSAAWNGLPAEIFLARKDSPESKALGLGTADLLAVSSSGTLAIRLEPRDMGLVRSGVLAQVHFAGSQPRALSTDILAADWLPASDRLVVVRRRANRCVLEWPVGRVVYETEGLISHVRSLPDGPLVAFIDHPRVFDDSGAVVVLDERAQRNVLSDGWSSVWGLAWSIDRREIWFTAARTGSTRSLHAVTLGGQDRVVAQTTGSLTLHDVASNGDVLASEDIHHTGVLFRSDHDNVERDLSWFDVTFPRDLSNDGSLLLFDETGDGGGTAYSAYVRPTDGRPAVRLGDGFAAALSPDKRWAATFPRSLREGISLIPIGPGEPLLVSDPTLEAYSGFAWLPDGEHVVFNAAEENRGRRLFVQRLGIAGVRPISPENIVGPLGVAPDSRYVLGADRGNRSTWLFPVEPTDSPQLLPQIGPDETPVQWSADGTTLFLRRRGGEMPLRVFRLNLVTGEKTLWREFNLTDRAGVTVIGDVRLTPDHRHYALAYRRILSNLFVFTGLK